MTVDASVVVASTVRTEPAYRDSRDLLALLRDEDRALLEPTLVLPEVAAAIARRYGDERLARAIALTFGRAGHVTLVSIDSALARRAVRIAALHRPRGADAVYIAVAVRFRASLVTLDEEQRRRASQVVPVLSPSEALALLS